MGLSRPEVELLSLREWVLRSQAYRRTERQAWERTLCLVNTVGGLAGADPITLDDLQDGKHPRRDGRARYEALKGRHIDWITTTS